VTFYDYWDFKTFREVFFDEEYKLDENPKTIVDLGANVGYSTAYWYINFPDAKILSVEPGSEAYARLQSLDNARVQTLQIAVSDHDGTVTLHKVGNASASSSLLNRSGETNTEEVRSVTLSTLLKDYTSVDVLKIDVEGSEEVILKDPAIHKVRIIIGEIHPDLIQISVQELLQHLEGFTYATSPLQNGRLLLKATNTQI